MTDAALTRDEQFEDDYQYLLAAVRSSDDPHIQADFTKLRDTIARLEELKGYRFNGYTARELAEKHDAVLKERDAAIQALRDTIARLEARVKECEEQTIPAFQATLNETIDKLEKAQASLAQVEQERDRLAHREDVLIKLLSVHKDYDGPDTIAPVIQRIIKQHDAALARVKELETKVKELQGYY